MTKDDKACTCYGYSRLMIQEGKAASIRYFNLCLEFRNHRQCFSGPIKAFCIKKLKDKKR